MMGPYWVQWYMYRNEYLKIAKLTGELFWGELFILSYNPHKWPKLNGCYRKIAPW